MTINLTKTKMAGLLLVASISGKTFANVATDLVIVNAATPFYIQIFETSKAQARAAGVTSSYGSSNHNKPDRMTSSEAQSYCQAIGMQIPTMDQWLSAASNVGQNNNYTLKGDTLSGNAYNIKSGDSVGIHKISQIGIDAVGTVGMSGNRAEWVAGGIQCGGSYQTNSTSDLKLSNICKTNGNMESATATVRCVIDVSRAGGQVTYSSHINSELRQYLSNLYSVAIPGSNAGGSNSNQGSQGGSNSAPAQVTMDDLDIDDDETSFN